MQEPEQSNAPSFPTALVLFSPQTHPLHALHPLANVVILLALLLLSKHRRNKDEKRRKETKKKKK